MARTMDLQERRERVSQAAWRVLVRDGPTELSVRKVAAEAGLPQSSLRYTFPTQASICDAAVELLLERVSARVAAARDSEPGVAGARAILLELLPLDSERRTEMEVSMSFLALAITDEALRHTYEKTHVAIRDACAQALEMLDAPKSELEYLHAAVDGLAVHLVRQPPATDTDWALGVLDVHLSRLGK